MSKKPITKFSLDPSAPPPLTRKQRAALEALRDLPNAAIDLSDIPEHSTFYRPVKKATTIRIDADVLAWLKKRGRGYQTRINAILRREMLSENGSCPTRRLP